MLDKQQAWNDLHRLTTDENSDVRSKAAYSLGSAFSHVPDKQQAWNDLHKLITDENNDVRSSAADALGYALSHVPDNQQAWNDLHRLANDYDGYVRNHAQYSLGKVSIFKASQAEDEEDYKKELENAIEFFGMAAQESHYSLYTSKFCLPFYRSFYTIIFKKQEEAKDEVNKYLKDAKAAIAGSKNKELLFEAVETLAKALEEVQNLGPLDLQGMKCELDSYRKYCENATELMRDVEETVPFATKTFMKGLPILDRNLKEIIEEIQEKAKIACDETKGTNVGEITCAISREVQQWEFGSQEEITQKMLSQGIENLIFILEKGVPNITKDKDFLNKIEKIREEKTLRFKSIA